eukprot:1158665-Pelagomonas_calceolata.AAC.11
MPNFWLYVFHDVCGGCMSASLVLSRRGGMGGKDKGSEPPPGAAKEGGAGGEDKAEGENDDQDDEDEKEAAGRKVRVCVGCTLCRAQAVVFSHMQAIACF